MAKTTLEKLTKDKLVAIIQNFVEEIDSQYGDPDMSREILEGFGVDMSSKYELTVKVHFRADTLSDIVSMEPEASGWIEDALRKHVDVAGKPCILPIDFDSYNMNDFDVKEVTFKEL